jgi:transcriptional regulator with XRE-family HTH domain
MTLLDQLIAIQKRYDWTDLEFSKRLGVSRQLWQFTRSGRMGISMAVLQGAYKAFPELHPAILSFLATDARNVTANAS